MRFLRTLVTCVAVLVAAQAQGAVIAFFNNASYVDVGEEAAHLRADLVTLGHTVNNFTGIAAADIETATSGADVLVISDLQNGDLFAGMSSAARAAVYDFVSGGGGFVTTANSLISVPNNLFFLNGIFGYSLVDAGFGGGPWSLNAFVAEGTAFEGGPASLPEANAVRTDLSTSLPAGSLNLYRNGTTTESALFASQVGFGRVVYVGYDWYQATTPAAWQDVLGRAVTHADVGGIPEPTTLAIWSTLGGLGMMIAARRRRRTA